MVLTTPAHQTWGQLAPETCARGTPLQLPPESNREIKDFESGSRGKQKPLLSQQSSPFHLTQNPIQQTGRLSPGKGDPGGIIFYGLGQDSLLVTGTKFSVESIQKKNFFFFVVADFTKLWLGRFWGQRARMSGIQSLVSYGREPPHASLAQVLFS